MIRTSLRLSAVVVALLLWSTPASPQGRRISPTERGRRLALVIGNNDYPWKPLTNAVNDARAVARLLPQLGFAEGDITLVTNAKLKELQRATRGFVEKLRSDDVAFVYYSGHGVEVRGENFLVPVDFPANATELEARDEAYSAQQLLKSLEDTNARVRLIILDACRDNPLRPSRSGSGGLAKMDGKGTLIIFATGAGQTADDNRGGSNGLFTSHLLRTLPTPGVPVDQLVKQVARNVHNARPDQTPAVYGLLYEDFTFVPARESRESSATNTCAEGWAIVKGERDPALLEQYLASAGNCPEATLARLTIAKLRSGTPQTKETFEEGRRLYDAKDYANARRVLLPLAQAGDSMAQAYLGHIYYFGYLGGKDYAQALQWYRLAAAQGEPVATNNLGVMYTTGQGVAVNHAESFRLTKLAAESGYAMAQANLGGKYREGTGVAINFAEALRWYRKAAEQNNASAQSDLGFMYENGYAVAKDLAEAARWYRKAADQGNTIALYNLGLCYEFGRGVSPDIAQAISYFDKAALNGHPDAKKRADDLRASKRR